MHNIFAKKKNNKEHIYLFICLFVIFLFVIMIHVYYIYPKYTQRKQKR